MAARARAGLDSASTFSIVQSLANWAHATDATILVALLQPEPQTYDLFDDIMVLANGRITYHGAREEVLPHFSRLGFEPTKRKAVADFLQVRDHLASPFWRTCQAACGSCCLACACSKPAVNGVTPQRQSN